MSADIHSEIPNASPILAYGESRASGGGRRIVVLVIAALVLISAGFGIWSYGHAVADMPDHIAVLVAVRGGTTLPSQSPDLWKIAVRGTKLPVVIGLAKTDVRWEPFAIVPRSSASAFAYHDPIFNFFSIVSDRKLERRAPMHLSALAYMGLSAWRHDAYLRLVVGEIFNGTDGVLSGVIDRGVWKTDARAPSSSVTLPDADIAINTAAFPDAIPSVHDMLSKDGLVWSEDAEKPLQAFGASWSEGGSRLLTFGYGPGSPSTSTLLRLAASAGITDEEKLTLPDNTILDDLRLPERFFDQTSSTRWMFATGTGLEITSSSIRFGDLMILPRPVGNECSSDAVLAHFSHQALQKLRIGADLIDLSPLNTLDVIAKDGRIDFCLR